MKFFVHLLTFLLLAHIRLLFNLNKNKDTLSNTNNNNKISNSNSFYTQSAMQFKATTINLLENLYQSSNLKTMCEDKKTFAKKYKKAKRFETDLKNQLPEDKNDEDYYKYYTYEEIVKELLNLAEEYSQFLKIETGQKLYGLPNPGGFCGDQKEKCYHYIVFLTDHKIDSKNKQQIYISGEVHGDEHVGPNAALELIKLFLKHKDSNKWIKHLLETRLIVITPMTNPNGYYKKRRSEQIKLGAYLDINRDFPYLVEKHKCMNTIGARLVNELYISHLFSLALTLHGGTESLTYPFGAPNHIKNSGHSIPLNYTEDDKGDLEIETNNNTQKMADQYRSGSFGLAKGESTEAPDYEAISNIASIASFHCVEDKRRRYKVGDMSNVVYPVTGGMEDWAYAGSWEGSPVITQPCEPKTYGGYDKEKTLYDKNYKDALKSIMFLLEVSNMKTPPRSSLGKRSPNDDCILNLRDNPFSIFNSEATNARQNCLDKDFDGYISKVLRLSLTLIDLLTPYITFTSKQTNGTTIDVSWVVGGALSVEETYVLYNFVDQESKQKLTFEEITNTFKTKSKVLHGKAIWDTNFTKAKDTFEVSIPIKDNNKKYIEFIVLAKVDKDWLKQDNPVPRIHPQTHIVNLRSNKDYVARNEKFVLNGKEYFSSEIFLLEIKK